VYEHAAAAQSERIAHPEESGGMLRGFFSVSVSAFYMRARAAR